MKNKIGLSTIIATLLTIMLLMIVTAIVWSFVNKTVTDKTKQTSSCLNLFDKIKFNNDYTCYDANAKTVHFSVEIADVTVDSVVVAISSASSKSFTITNTAQTISGLTNYPDGSTSIILPGKNSGKTYIASGFNEQPDSLKIAPIIDGQQCDITGTVNNIDTC